MKLIYSQSQHQGAREYQQDAMDVISNKSDVLAVLADGMGGYKGGEIASKKIIDNFNKNFSKLNRENISKGLIDILNTANKAIENHKLKEPEVNKMGSTFVGLFISNETYQWISVGDSPLYIVDFSKDTIERINANHSIGGILEMQYKKGEISSEELANNPNKHMLTSAVTGDPISILEESKIYPLNKEQLFIVASDGLETILRAEILDILKKYNCHSQKGLNDATKGLIQAVLSKNKRGQDNVSVILISNEQNQPPKSFSAPSNQRHKDKNQGNSSIKYLFLSIIMILTFFVIGLLAYDKYIKPMFNKNTQTIPFKTKDQINKDTEEFDIKISPFPFDNPINKEQVLTLHFEKEVELEKDMIKFTPKIEFDLKSKNDSKKEYELKITPPTNQKDKITLTIDEDKVSYDNKSNNKLEVTIPFDTTNHNNTLEGRN